MGGILYKLQHFSQNTIETRPCVCQRTSESLNNLQRIRCLLFIRFHFHFHLRSLLRTKVCVCVCMCCLRIYVDSLLFLSLCVDGAPNFKFSAEQRRAAPRNKDTQLKCPVLSCPLLSCPVPFRPLVAIFTFSSFLLIDRGLRVLGMHGFCSYRLSLSLSLSLSLVIVSLKAVMAIILLL